MNGCTKKYQHYCGEAYDRFVNGRKMEERVKGEEYDEEADISVSPKESVIDKPPKNGSLANIKNLITEIEKMRLEITE